MEEKRVVSDLTAEWRSVVLERLCAPEPARGVLAQTAGYVGRRRGMRTRAAVRSQRGLIVDGAGHRVSIGPISATLNGLNLIGAKQNKLSRHGTTPVISPVGCWR